MNDKLDKTLIEIKEELEKAIKKFPTQPIDPLHAVSVLGEEYGELVKEIVQYTYEPEKSSKESIKTEAIQTAAMAIRFILSLEEFEYKKSKQHKTIKND